MEKKSKCCRFYTNNEKLEQIDQSVYALVKCLDGEMLRYTCSSRKVMRVSLSKKGL